MKRLLAVFALLLFLTPMSCDSPVTEPEIQGPEIQPPSFAPPPSVVIPRSGEIIYTSGTASGNDLVLKDLRTGAVTNLTAALGGLNQMPEWSPNGKAVVFSRSPSGDFGDLRVWMGVWAPSGSFNVFGPIMFLPPWEQCPQLFPTWSPNGQHIAFICGQNNGGWGHLWVATYNSTSNMWEPMPLTAGDLIGSRPTWWGDDRIVFSSLQPGPGGTQRDLFFIKYPPRPPPPQPIWGVELGTLTNTPDQHEDNPSWGDVSTGDNLVYNVVRNLGDPTEASDIFTATVGVVGGNSVITSTPVQLTKSGSADYPSWTPEGDKILFVQTNGSGVLSVFEMSPTGTALKNLVNSKSTLNLWAKRRPGISP